MIMSKYKMKFEEVCKGVLYTVVETEDSYTSKVLDMFPDDFRLVFRRHLHFQSTYYFDGSLEKCRERFKELVSEMERTRLRYDFEVVRVEDGRYGLRYPNKDGVEGYVCEGDCEEEMERLCRLMNENKDIWLRGY
jgi:hypothetical protein